jgi:ATP-dependent metalloprotease FtsH
LKTLLLTAKAFALDENSQQITLDHLKRAFLAVEFIDKEAQKKLSDLLKLEYLMDEAISTKKYEDAKKAKRVNFDDEVKQIKSSMEKEGYSLTKTISKIFTLNKGKDMEVGEDLLKVSRSIKESLAQKLFGQERAIEAVADSIKNNILGNSNGPQNTYLFLGPPATGKTYLSQLMGENLTEYKIKKFDMTQFTHEESGGALYGTSRQWGNAKTGSLTSFVRENPKSIIVLDEFEKANNSVQANLLSIFEGGYLQDVCGWCKDNLDTPWGEGGKDENKCSESEIDDIVDFKQTIFIITSNLGKELYSDHKFLALIDNDYTQAESMILDALQRETKTNNKSGGEQQAIIPELLSRFSQANVILFNKLTYQVYEAIASKAFNEYKEQFTNTFGIQFNDTADFNHFLKVEILRFAPQLDARRIKSKIGINFFDKITDYIIGLSEGIEYCKEINITVSQNVKSYIAEVLDNDIVNGKLVNELFRKNLTLDVENAFTSKNGVVTYHIESIKLKKSKRVQDFSEDGLVFDVPEVTFQDIAGHAKAKVRLSEAITFLKNPKRLEAFAIKPPKGMLLYGPPGTGKTLLAKAFAAEADLPFIATTGTDLLDPDRTKKIFSKAKEYAPSIVFIDEIDALGQRGKNNGREIAINKLLSEMDGFSNDPEENIFVVAATNYKEHIDSAIIRPGRIELHIEIDSLDKEARKYFIDKIIEEKPTSGKFDVDKIIMYTAGMTGAQLEMIGKEASIYCIRHGLDTITQEIVIEQINTIKYGEKLTHLSLEEILEETAIHEAAHAVLSKVLMPHIKIEQITVTPRGNALGFVSYDNEDRYDNMTIKDFKDRIAIAFAGRVAQIKKYGEIEGLDTGASNDLKQATQYAYSAISRYGMDEKVGYINLDGIQDNALKNHYFEKIDQAVASWMEEGRSTTQDLLDKHWNKIEKLSMLLIKQEVIYEDELDALLEK